MSRDDDPLFKKWAEDVKKRDSYTCQICTSRGVYLESHHKNSWDRYIEERYDVDNGVALCKRCHERFHNMFGYGNNTKFQFKQYQQMVDIFRKILSSDNPPDFLSQES